MHLFPFQTLRCRVGIICNWNSNGLFCQKKSLIGLIGTSINDDTLFLHIKQFELDTNLDKFPDDGKIVKKNLHRLLNICTIEFVKIDHGYNEFTFNHFLVPNEGFLTKIINVIITQFP